jgi:transposase
LEKDLTPRLEAAKKGERKVYFVDAAHFVHGAFVSCLWCLTRIFMPTPSGRSRYNVLGAIDAVSHDLITVCNTTYINAESVCELLMEIAAEQIKNALPITLVLDNARYQRCDFVQNRAKELGIELLFLPSYSPNLNIIERLWKWTKKDCLNCKYYSKSSEFVDAIQKSLQKTKNKENKNDLDTLLVLNFQLYDNSIYNRA